MCSSFPSKTTYPISIVNMRTSVARGYFKYAHDVTTSKFCIQVNNESYSVDTAQIIGRDSALFG